MVVSNRNLLFPGGPHFQGLLLLVSGRVIGYIIQSMVPGTDCKGRGLQVPGGGKKQGFFLRKNKGIKKNINVGVELQTKTVCSTSEKIIFKTGNEGNVYIYSNESPLQHGELFLF